MGECNDEHDAIIPEPAVVLPSHISGRRRVRVPEIVHTPCVVKEQNMELEKTASTGAARL